MQAKNTKINEAEVQLLREIGGRIEFYRKARGVGMEEMASVIGINRSSVSNVEKGRHKLDIVKLVRIAKRLQISLLDLVPEDGSSIGNLRLGDREHLSAIREHLVALRSNETAKDEVPNRLERAQSLVRNIPEAAFSDKDTKISSQKG